MRTVFAEYGRMIIGILGGCAMIGCSRWILNPQGIFASLIAYWGNGGC